MRSVVALLAFGIKFERAPSLSETVMNTPFPANTPSSYELRVIRRTSFISEN